VPAPGIVAGAVKAKVPETEAAPPLKMLLARLCPLVIALATGQTLTAGDQGATVTLTVFVTDK